MAVQAEHSNFSREIVDDLAGNVKQCRNPGLLINSIAWKFTTNFSAPS